MVFITVLVSILIYCKGFVVGVLFYNEAHDKLFLTVNTSKGHLQNKFLQV